MEGFRAAACCVLYGCWLFHVSAAAPSVWKGEAEETRQSRMLGMRWPQEGSLAVVVVMVVMPILLLSLISCCRVNKRERIIEKDELEACVDSTRKVVGSGSTKDWTSRHEKITKPDRSLISDSSKEVIVKQTAVIDRPQRRSFKLAVLPAEDQAKTTCSSTGTIPIPKIVENSWKNAAASGYKKLLPVAPEDGQDFNKEPQGSEDEDISTSSQHKMVLQYTASASVVASHLAITPPGGKPVLQHARSLDNLLAAHRKVTVVWNPDATSKYSNMTITAATDVLNEDMTVVNKNTTSRSGDKCKRLRGGEVSVVMVTGEHARECSPDAASIVSYTLTPDMFGRGEQEEEEPAFFSHYAGERKTSGGRVASEGEEMVMEDTVAEMKVKVVATMNPGGVNEEEEVTGMEMREATMKFEAPLATDTWPSPNIEDSSASTTLKTTRGFEVLLPPEARTSVVDKRTKILLRANKDEISSEAMEGLKLALFHMALPNKTTLTPIPIVPPSTPTDFEMVLEPAESLSGFQSSYGRPTSTQSLPPVDIVRPSLKQLLLRSLPPSPPSPLSPSSSDNEAERAMPKEGRESTLDRGVRSSSPCPYSSTESLAEEQNVTDNLHSILLLTQSHDSARVRTKTWTTMMERRISSPFPSMGEQSRSDPDDWKRRSETQRRPLCTECGVYVPFTIKDDAWENGIRDENAPLYHVLERPEMCDACFRKDQRRNSEISPHSTSPSLLRKVSPSLPHFPSPHSSMMLTCSKDSTYEAVLLPVHRGTDSPKSRKESFSLNLMNANKDPTSDYESISPFSPEYRGGTSTRQFNRRNTRSKNDSGSSHDYESIKLVNEGGFDHMSGDSRGGRLEQLHDYTHISGGERIEEADTPGVQPQGTFYTSAKAARKKLMKIDSHGYASVMPTIEAKDDTCELDHLHQEGPWRDDVGPPPSSSPNRVTVSNVEEAWQHQQERGYAALTLKPRPHCYPPPLISRTSSDGLLSTSLPRLRPGATAQDYEVPIPLRSIQPPLAVTNRKNSAPQMRNRSASSPIIEQGGVLRRVEGDCARLSSVSERDNVGTKEHAKDIGLTVLSSQVATPTRKHSASDIMDATTHALRLSRRSQ